MLVGRDAERAAIRALLDAARGAQSGALVLRGEPGIGKTALLEDACEQAKDMHVLPARGVESESDLPFAGIHQLIRPALHLIDQLPAPQAGALQGALGLANGSANHRFLISAGCLSLLSELARQKPVLCLVDNAQWLDAPSADALLFVARRLEAESIAMLFATRESKATRFDARDLEGLELRGLDFESAASLLARLCDEEIDPAVRDVLIEQSGGNPLALVELPSSLSPSQLSGEEALPGTLPLTREVERLFLERVRRLPDPTQRLLLIVAADDTEQLGTVMRAAEAIGIREEALEPAERAGVVSVRGTSLEMRHPLVRSAVYQRAPSRDRRAAHLALAEALDGELESDHRAWHRAAAATGPDAGVAAELESTADRAQLRSGHASAATALVRAAELSIDTPSRARRLVAAAGAAWHAGQPERALSLLDQAGPMVKDAPVRAELCHVRGEIEFRCRHVVDAYETLMTGAAEAAPLDSRKALEMLFDAANAGAYAGDYARVAEAGLRAAALSLGDNSADGLLVGLLIGVGGLQESKTADELPRILEAIAHSDDFDEPRWLIWAAGGAQVVGDAAKAADLLRRAVALARASGQREKLIPALASFVLDGMIEGRHAVAAEAAEGLELARDARLRNPTSIFLAVLAWLAAVRGQNEECRAFAAEASESAQATGNALASSIAKWARSLLDLTRGRPKETLTHLAAVREGPGVGHPYIALLSTPDLVEASVRTGLRKHARAAFAALERFAQPGAPPWSRALAARCRALLAQGEEAEGEFVDALRFHAESNRPFDRARTALLFGEFLRRDRRRTDAREHLRSALDGFEQVAAEPWAKRARAELRASGVTARKRDPSTINRLTPQELQIARFVAEGLSNKEVAAQLFLSPRTIDYHLRRVFVKLEITSRTQLARFDLGPEPARVTPARTVAST